MNIIPIIIFLISSTISCQIFAHEKAETHEILTHEKSVKLFDDITIGKNIEIIDRDTYLIINASSNQKFYAFTKTTHPAHPGYIEWNIIKENEKLLLQAKGTHGVNKIEFIKFETLMNQTMLNYIKHTFSKLNYK